MRNTPLCQGILQELENILIDILAGYAPVRHPAVLPLAEGNIKEATYLMYDILSPDIRRKITVQLNARISDELQYTDVDPELITIQIQQLPSLLD